MVEHLALDAHPSALVSLAQSLSRLANLEEELETRRLTAKDFDLREPDYISPSSDLGDTPVLLAAASIDEGLIRTNIQSLSNLTVVSETFTAADQITTGNFDVLILAVPKGTSGHDEMWVATECRDNVRLFNLPIIFICEPDTFSDLDEAYKAGANAVITRDQLQAQLQTRAMQQLRRQVYRRGLLGACQSYLRKQTRDSLTGLFTAEFFRTHLQNEIAFADANDKALSVSNINISLDSDAIAEGATDVAEDAHTRYIRRIGYLLARLIRGEDLVAHNAGKTFSLIMPGTSLAAAQKVLRRICAVVNTTELEVISEEGQIAQYAAAEVTQIEAGDNIDTVLARIA
jgi:diguanylate cyclase (GGDEF)-like protein